MLRGIITVEPPSASRVSVTFYRSLAVSFLFGMLFGPIFAFSKNINPVEYAWYGSFKLAVFGGILSLMVRLPIKQHVVVNAAVVGAVAGVTGYLVWTGLTAPSWKELNWAAEIKKSMIGADYGVGVSSNFGF